MAVRRHARRAEGFAVRRWLQVGAASAGVGAGLLGFSLLGPQVGTAAADTAGESSTSSSAATSDDDAKPAESANTLDDTATDDTAADESADDDSATDDSAADEEAEADLDDEADLAEEAAELAEEAEADDADDPTSRDRASGSADADADTADLAESTAAETDSPRPPTAVRVSTPRNPVSNWSEFAGQSIDKWTTSSQGWIKSLPVDSQAQYHLAGALWATRRTLFNQAPDVAPIQISGKLDGPMTGTVGAVDPDGDRLVYVLTRGPSSGSVQLNADGTYTYTPGEGFDGVDTFRVVAIDVGPHVNLLDPFRPVGTRATNLVNQRAIRFDFTYTTGSEHWTPERRQALQDAADDLVLYFLVTKPVVLTYEVTALDDPDSTTLASAGSDLISDDPGFWPTIVQHKLLTGEDANGSAADGGIDWNFGNEWALGDVVGPDEFDFNSTAIHELLHSFGFLSGTGAPGENEEVVAWVLFDKFMVTRDRARPINRDFQWDTAFDPNLTGGDGGLYFGGVHAVSAYGDLVPLYTPDPWAEGSSTSHLDDDTFSGSDQKVMNAGSGTGFVVRALSPLELGILRDLGYRVDAPPPAVAAMALIGFLFVGRRWRGEALANR
ncbi:Ig-like domain-containing protein [Mycolicibacterium litorale]|uniref:Uncharacterized protein n=1 Tax=Mycolicibacterium litorale TaxID=758802 RepID=A0AAD1IMU1_9MYCO|nr:Ig-like domain-containing protein [Mycolicibacterium litorale]MCV7417401.1 Ig-like domain-containing protein [Mycolicibacterium litorale]TDY05190.1 hypothetical protein BCL50_3978 [Mycolicibacterium litorale]BBY18625.1 hypothetical protein MLIT_42170 [Mycolicibacterium litorale]